MGDAAFALAADSCFLHHVYGHPLLADLFHWAVFVKLYQVDPCLIINCMSISPPLSKLLVLILCFKGIVTLWQLDKFITHIQFELIPFNSQSIP